MAKEQSQIAKWRFAIIKSELPPSVRHVLLTLAIHMNADGTIPANVTPGVRLLAEEVGKDKDTISRSLTKAQTLGWLQVEQGKGRSRNRYQAVIPDSVVSPLREHKAPP